MYSAINVVITGIPNFWNLHTLVPYQMIKLYLYVARVFIYMRNYIYKVFPYSNCIRIQLLEL